jgi:hypothetical protein
MKTVFLLITFIISLNASGETKESDKFKNMYTCFDIKQVEASVEYDNVQWINEDKIDVCELGFRISSSPYSYSYLTRNWRSPLYCNKFMKEWKKLKKGNEKICIAAYLSSTGKRKYKGKEILEQSGFWEVIKTENWCHTYFVGNCQGIPNSTESF